jgi:hypothetical protein
MRGVLETFTVATFTPLVGSEFKVVVAEGETVTLRLAQASSVSSGGGIAAGYAREPFSLVFHGPLQPALPQHTYTFGHERLGAFELFIVPIGPDEVGPRYEAVFT